MAQAEFDKQAWRLGRVEKRAARTSRPTFFVLLFDAGLLCLVHALAGHGSRFAYPGAVFLLLLALLHFYLVLHECAHGTVFAHSRHNELLGHFLGFVILCPFLTRRRSHAMHHKYAAHPELDPTNARAVKRLSTLTPGALALLDLLWRSHVPFLALFERVGLFLAPFSADHDERGAAAERRATYGYLAGYAAVIACLVWFEHLGDAVAFYAPAWVLLLMMEEMINLPHHLDTPLTRERLAFWEQGRVTHSCAQVPVWSRFVLMNCGLHTAHHLWVSYAWHELPAAHLALAKMTTPSVVSNELVWSIQQRRRPFASVMSEYIKPRQIDEKQAAR